MKEIEIDVIELKGFQRVADSFVGIWFCMLWVPDFRDDVYGGAWERGGSDSILGRVARIRIGFVGFEGAGSAIIDLRQLQSHCHRAVPYLSVCILRQMKPGMP